MDNGTSSEISIPRHMLYGEAVFVLRILIAIIIIPGNILVVLSVAKFDYLRTIPNLFIANLAVGDMLTSFLTIPVYDIFYYYNLNIKNCYLIFCCALIPFLSSLTFLVIIALDRTLCIAKPFWYQRHVTMRRAVFLTVSCWLFTILSSFMSLLYPYEEHDGDFCYPEDRLLTPTYVTVGSIMFAGYAFMMTGLYLYISHISWTQACRITVQTQCADVRIQNEAKIRKMLVTILGVFYLCWTPQLILYIIKYLYRYNPPEVQTLEVVTEFICVANSFMNPVIYAKQNEQFNTAFRKLLCLDSNTKNGRIRNGRVGLLVWMGYFDAYWGHDNLMEPQIWCIPWPGLYQI